MGNNIDNNRMKIVVLGDIHGLTVWKDIIDKEQPDQVIFLGDYVSSHEGISPPSRDHLAARQPRYATSGLLLGGM